MTRTFVLAVAAVSILSGPALAQHAPASSDKTVSLQGDQGAFGQEAQMRPFFEILLEAHKQGDKADLKAMEEKIIRRAELMFSDGKPISKGMQDHVLGVAHQALAIGVSNPKIFESYESFMTLMAGPQ